jgi:enterochelin esterase-like enzyme
MQLTSGFFIALTIIAAVAGLAATVWIWPRVSRRRTTHLAARLGLIAGSQALAVVALLAVLNGYFLFFGSWSVLVNTGGVAPQVTRSFAAAASSKPVVVTGADLGPVPGSGSRLPRTASGQLAFKPPHFYRKNHINVAYAIGQGQKRQRALRAVGEVLEITIRGEHTGISSANDFVYLPPQYFQAAYAHARFPVVLALTGYPNDTWSIVKFLGLPATAASLTASKRIAPAVYVMMNVSPALPRDTECTNVPAGLQVESFFAQDVPAAIEHAFRVQSSRTGWAVLGYSTGGYCAAKLAMMYPYQFSAAISLSGYYNAILDRTTGNLYGGSVAYRNENDLDWRLKHLPAPPVSVLVTSTLVGEAAYPGTLAFLRLIRLPMRGYSLILQQGGHNYNTWGRELPQALQWLNHRLSAAQPLAPPPVKRG